MENAYSVRLPAELLKRMRDLKAVEGISLKAMMVKALTAYLDAWEGK